MVIAVFVLAVGMRRRRAHLCRVLLILAVIPSLLSMAWPLLYFSELPTQEKWMAHSPEKTDSEMLVRATGQVLGTVDFVRIILSAGFGTTLLCLLIAYGLGTPRRRFEHALGMAIGAAFAVIAGSVGQIVLRIGEPYWERPANPHSPPPPASDAALGSYYLWCVSISAVVLLASIAFVLFSLHRFRCLTPEANLKRMPLAP